MDDCESLISQPLTDAFGRSLYVDSHQGDCRVMFPFRRVDGDPVILYVISEDDGSYTITDDGETHGMLLTSGVDIDTDTRKERVSAAATRFDLDEAEKEVRATATRESLADRIIDVFQAAYWISFLVYTRSPYSPSYFKDRVAGFLRQNNIQFAEEQEVNAESEPQTVDFEILNQPSPTFLESIHARNPSDLLGKSRDTSYKWIKIERVTEDARFITMLDDEDGEFIKENMQPLFDDSDAVIPWTERDGLLEIISA